MGFYMMQSNLIKPACVPLHCYRITRIRRKNIHMPCVTLLRYVRKNLGPTDGAEIKTRKSGGRKGRGCWPKFVIIWQICYFQRGLPLVAQRLYWYQPLEQFTEDHEYQISLLTANDSWTNLYFRLTWGLTRKSLQLLYLFRRARKSWGNLTTLVCIPSGYDLSTHG